MALASRRLQDWSMPHSGSSSSGLAAPTPQDSYTLSPNSKSKRQGQGTCHGANTATGNRAAIGPKEAAGQIICITTREAQKVSF